MPQFSFSDYELIRVEVFWVSLVGIWLLYSLLAFWVATRDWHWFLRIVLLVVVSASFKLIESDDLMLMQLFNCLTVFGLVVGWRTFWKWKKAPEPSQDRVNRFSLANLMLVVALVALLLSIIAAGRTDIVSSNYSIAFGCAVGLAFMTGIGVARVKNLWVTLTAVFVAASGIYPAYHWIFPKQTKGILYYLINPTSFIWGELGSFGKAILVAMAISGLVVGFLQRGSLQKSWFGMVLTRIGCVLVALIICLFAVSSIDLGCRLAFRYPPRSVPTKESQYDKLVPITASFDASEILEAYDPEAKEAILRKELRAFEGEFAKVRTLLDTPETLPLPYYIENYWEGLDAASPRSVAHALSKKARFEFADGLVDQSLSSSVLAIRLREPVAGNRLQVHELVALGVEGIGHEAAAESIPSASKQAIAEALKQILEVDARIIEPELIYANDQAVAWQTANWLMRLRMLCDARSTREPFDTSIVEAIHRVDAVRKQLIVMLALELHRRDKENYPQSLELLVPQYLEAVPSDPFSTDNLPLKYLAVNNGADYLLYSVGYNQQDDGGKLHEWHYAGGSADDECDLNFREGARLLRLERDAVLAKQAELE